MTGEARSAPPDATASTARRLPDGFAVRLRADLLRKDDNLLVGGSPLRSVRLSARARGYLQGDRVVVRDKDSAQLAGRLLDANLADPEAQGAGVEPAEITVVIPVRDRPDQLDRCLAALGSLELVVVDDASKDRAAVAAVVARHGARLVRLDRNVGPAGARNAGLALVRTPYVAFVDSDVEVGPDVLLGLSAHFADRSVALVGPLVRGVCRSARPRWFEKYDVSTSSLDLGLRGSSVRPGATVAWLPSACMLARVTVVRDGLDGFDERMRVGEDVDLVWRLVRAGAVVRYDPERVARHDTRSTLRGWLGRKFVYGTGGAPLAARHGDWVAPAVLGTTSAVGAAALLLRRPWSLPLAAASVAMSARGLQQVLPESSRCGVPLSLDVACRGMGWAVRQESALLLRHWWPATLGAALLSRNARRTVATALIVDGFVTVTERRGAKPLTALFGRRLDDLAYGAGLWAGAVGAHDLRCLVPRAPRLRTQASGAQQGAGLPESSPGRAITRC